MANAAVYLRSSKDRHDVSIASQERELQKLAKSKDLQIVREYVDVVESAKNEFRPAFQELMRDVRSPARGWDTLLTLDTSRLSRRRYVSLVFKHDAKKNGVQILYAKMPEVARQEVTSWTTLRPAQSETDSRSQNQSSDLQTTHAG